MFYRLHKHWSNIVCLFPGGFTAVLRLRLQVHLQLTGLVQQVRHLTATKDQDIS